MLDRVIIPSHVTEIKIPDSIKRLINETGSRIETFQDRWDRTQIEQFVAADYEHVYQSMRWTLESQPLIGHRFLEWGCGFAVVSVIASMLNLDAIGIEAEADLIAQGHKTIDQYDAPVELVHGNFLPAKAESLAEDPTLPSLGHAEQCAYGQLGLDIDDFSIIYSYPWPGEELFHQDVFAKYAAKGALLLQFCGPNDLRLHRRV